MDTQEGSSKKYLKAWHESLPNKEPSPHLKTRVLARFDELQGSGGLAAARAGSERPFWLRWQVLAPVAMAATVILGIGVWLGTYWQNRAYLAGVNQPVEVAIQIGEVSQAKGPRIARATVELPIGMQFFVDSRSSGLSPEAQAELESRVAQMHTLDLELTAEAAREPLPIVVKSLSPGIKRVRIRFYDDGGAVVAEREKEIRFTEEKRGTL